MDPIKVKLTEKDQERDYKSDVEILAQDKTEQRKGWLFEKLVRGNPASKNIALTFDDGPHEVRTPALLAALKKLNVRATFFVIGEEAQFHPELVKAEIAAGHQVSNHTYHHARLNHVLTELIEPEISACDAVLSTITGKPADRYLRPPGGEYDSDVISACKKLGKTIVLYTDDPADYMNPPENVLFDRTMKAASDGGILLFHDGVDETVHLLPRIVSALRAKGYRFVTISELDAAARTAATVRVQKSAPLPRPRKAGFPKGRLIVKPATIRRGATGATTRPRAEQQ
jgi:peptidoglycan/xylan/chitin deacetylase (PgdA/CDA1 family)